MPAETVHCQQPEREQQTLTQVWDAKDVGERFQKLHGFPSIPGQLTATGRADYLRGSARPSADLFQSRFRKMVGFHRDLPGQRAAAEHF